MKPRRSGARKLSRTATRTRRERGVRESPPVAGCADPRLVTGRKAVPAADRLDGRLERPGFDAVRLRPFDERAMRFGTPPKYSPSSQTVAWACSSSWGSASNGVPPRSGRHEVLHPAAHDFHLTSVSGSRQTYIQVYTSGDGTKGGDRVSF